jgi:hypothetical protein
MELVIDMNSTIYCPLPPCGGGWRAAKRRAGRGVGTGSHDRVEDSASVTQNFIIPEPQHAKPLIFEPSRTPAVCFAMGVLSAIHFDNETSFKGHEIHDVSSDHRLSLELDPLKTMRAK